MPRDRQLTQTLLNLTSNASSVSAFMELTGFSSLVITLRVTTTTSATGGSVTLRGTNFSPPDATSPGLKSGVELNGAVAALGYTPASGLFTFAIGTGGTFITNVGFSEGLFPQFLAADYAAGTGGGTFTLQVIAAGW